jgi:hypothetical protein
VVVVIGPTILVPDAPTLPSHFVSTGLAVALQSTAPAELHVSVGVTGLVLLFTVYVKVIVGAAAPAIVMVANNIADAIIFFITISSMVNSIYEKSDFLLESHWKYHKLQERNSNL